jgi:hypothetical protein
VEREVIVLILSTRETALNGVVIGLIVRSEEMELDLMRFLVCEPIKRAKNKEALIESNLQCQ